MASNSTKLNKKQTNKQTMYYILTTTNKLLHSKQTNGYIKEIQKKEIFKENENEKKKEAYVYNYPFLHTVWTLWQCLSN